MFILLRAQDRLVKPFGDNRVAAKLLFSGRNNGIKIAACFGRQSHSHPRLLRSSRPPKANTCRFVLVPADAFLIEPQFVALLLILRPLIPSCEKLMLPFRQNINNAAGMAIAC